MRRSRQMFMEFQQQRFVEETVVELPFCNGETYLRDSLGQEWRDLRVTQDPERGVDEAGIPIWRRIFWSVSEEIASPSKAIVLATLSGIAWRRRRRFSCGGSLRHWSIFCCHVILTNLLEKQRLGKSGRTNCRIGPSFSEQHVSRGHRDEGVAVGRQVLLAENLKCNAL